MPDFSKRSDGVEIMDDLACAGEVIHQTLREIENINRLLGGNYVTVDGVKKAIGNGQWALGNAGEVHSPRSTVHGNTGKTQKVLNVTDLGCGGGDLLKLIRKWAVKRNIQLSYTGIDANPNIVKY